jgi:dihydropteroate synthase
MPRKIFYWKLRESELQLGERTLIMGVLNVTPDSFSDGGLYSNPDRAYARALELEEQGADIIDIGAESTKPGSQRISADEEWQRLVPVLKRLRGNLRVPLSLDSYKAEIAERSIEYGVEIFNDPSGLTFDPHLAKVAATANAGLILNHMRGLPETWPRLPPMQDPVGTIARELEATVSRARHSNVERNRIVIDPGLGFGKRREQNSEILARLEQLAALDLPILVGPSRKSFLAQVTEDETLFATAAAVTAAVLNGAHIVRVHDVKEMKAVIQVAEEIARAVAPAPVVEERRPARPPRPQISETPPALTPPVKRAPAKREDGWRPPVRREEGDRPRLTLKREGGDDRPPRREFKPAARSDFKPRSEGDARPPRREFKPRSEGDARPPRREFKPRSEGDARPPRREFKPRSEGSARPPRGDFKPKGFKGPKRPFRKRP